VRRPHARGTQGVPAELLATKKHLPDKRGNSVAVTTLDLRGTAETVGAHSTANRSASRCAKKTPVVAADHVTAAIDAYARTTATHRYRTMTLYQ